MEQKQYTVNGDYNQLLTANYNLSKRTYKIILLLKQIKSTSLNKSSSILFGTLSTCIATYKENLRFYTEKKTLHWIAFDVMTFI